MKKVFGVVLFFAMATSLHAQTPAPVPVPVGPFTFLTNLYHAALHVAMVPADVAEYASAEVAHYAAKVDYYLDSANGENPALVALKAQKAKAKAAKHN